MELGQDLLTASPQQAPVTPPGENPALSVPSGGDCDKRVGDAMAAWRPTSTALLIAEAKWICMQSVLEFYRKKDAVLLQLARQSAVRASCSRTASFFVPATDRRPCLLRSLHHCYY
jgi:hypothetical protein